MDTRQRSTRPLISILALALLGLAPIRVWAQTAATAPVGNVQNGKQSFTTRTCGTCHGNDAQGTAGGGPRIGPPDRSFADFLQYVRMPTGNMPPVSSQRVPDSEIADIYAYLRTVAPAAAALSATSGNVANGKKIFASYGCYECHGFEGQGSKQTGAPPIGPPAISMSAFARYVRQPTGEMPPYTSKVISDQDLADIYAFLQSIALPPPIKNIPLLNQ
jgi:mono/diheme cytochrome c family protein